MKIKIRLAKNSDLEHYTSLLQRTYENAYTKESIGLTKDCFSKEIFGTPDTQTYLKSNLQISGNQKTWLAFIDDKIVGSITIQRKNNECELRGFYVDIDYQEKGIGKKLWQHALDFSKKDDIVLDIYTHNTKTIEMYIKWGFEIDKKRGTFTRHWPEWPEGVNAECLYMRLRK